MNDCNGSLFPSKDMQFADMWEAFEWMYKKQLGRRNLTDEQKTYMIGKMYEAKKKSHGASDGFRGNQSVSAQNEPLPKGPNRTSVIIAHELGIGKETVKRSEKFSKGIDAIKEVSPEAAGKILAGNSGINKAAVMDLVKKNEDEVKEFAESVVSGEAKQQKKKRSGQPQRRTGVTATSRPVGTAQSGKTDPSGPVIPRLANCGMLSAAPYSPGSP